MAWQGLPNREVDPDRCWPAGQPSRLWTSPVLQESFLMEIAGQLTDESYPLALYLDLPPIHMANLLMQLQGNSTNHPWLMLDKWNKKFAGNDHQWTNKLREGLNKVHRIDLAREIGRMTVANSTHGEIMCTIGYHLSRDWYTLGIYLGLSADELDRIRAPAPHDENLHFNLLLCWRNSSRHIETMMEDQLKDALIKVRRNDLALKVRQVSGLEALQRRAGNIDNATASPVRPSYSDPSFPTLGSEGAGPSLRGGPVSQPDDAPLHEVTRQVRRLDITWPPPPTTHQGTEAGQEQMEDQELQMEARDPQSPQGTEAGQQQMEEGGEQNQRFPTSAHTLLGRDSVQDDVDHDTPSLSLPNTLGPRTTSGGRSVLPMSRVTGAEVESMSVTSDVSINNI